MPSNYVFVQMKDGSTFEQMIDRFSGYDVPYWMQTNQAQLALNFLVLIRSEKNHQFTSILLPSNRHRDYNPYPHGPVYAEIRIGRKGYYTAKNFELYVPPHRKPYYRIYFPPNNRIYITMPLGPIYSSILEKYVPPSRDFTEALRAYNRTY